MEPYFIIMGGVMGSGKSCDKGFKFECLPYKTIKYLNLTNYDVIYDVDEHVQNSFFYKKNVNDNINKYFKNDNKQITEIFKYFDKTYFSSRKKIDPSINKKINKSIKNKENIILETTGRFFPTIINEIPDDYYIIISYALLDFCILIERNLLRSMKYINNVLKDKSNPAPRIPDVTFDVFEKVVHNILEKLVVLIKNCNKNECTFSGKKYRLLIFHSEKSHKKPIFDSAKIPNKKYINDTCKMILEKYKASPKCHIH